LPECLQKTNRFTIDDIINSKWFNGPLPTKEELITDLTERKKVVDGSKKKQAEEQLKVKSGGAGKAEVYRGEGDNLDGVVELLNSLDLNDYATKSYADFDFKGKFNVFNFNGDKDNDNSIEKVFKNLYISLKRKNAEIELVPKSYNFQASINNYKYFEDDIEVEEDIGFSVELYTNGEFSTNAIILKDENTNIFTFKKFCEDWKTEFSMEDA